MINLHQMTCASCDKQTPLDAGTSRELLSQLVPAWKMDADAKQITRLFSFKHFWQTMGFVNAVAWIAHQENHHPDLTLGFNYCEVRFTTHTLHQLSQNDFICAAKVDRLFLPASG